MVHIDRVYTRGGDGGATSLGDGSRVPKSSPRVTAIGAVDETNAAIGTVLAGVETDPATTSRLTRIQNDLFDLGADLAVPAGDEAGSGLRVVPEQVSRLEEWIDEVNARLSPLDSFVLPGGTPEAAGLHLARTICRRAEANCVALAETEDVSPHVLAYLNRLSDLLFVLARAANDEGRGDVKWIPGGHRDTD